MKKLATLALAAPLVLSGAPAVAAGNAESAPAPATSGAEVSSNAELDPQAKKRNGTFMYKWECNYHRAISKGLGNTVGQCFKYKGTWWFNTY